MIKLFPDSKTFISIFNVDIAWYAVIIITGALIALYLSKKDSETRGINAELVEDIFFGVLIFGLIGARLWYVLFYPDISYYLNNPMKILAFRDGGLAIQGALFGGAGYAYYAAKKRNINFMDLADSALNNVLLAQAIGRWGNFVNQEAYGQIVSESFYKYFPAWFKNHMYIDNAYRQPMFFFESVLNLIGFLLIRFTLSKIKTIKRGDYTYAYLVWYGIVRFIIEHFRSDSLMFLGMKSAQIISVIFVIVGGLGLYGIFRKEK